MKKKKKKKKKNVIPMSAAGSRVYVWLCVSFFLNVDVLNCLFVYFCIDSNIHIWCIHIYKQPNMKTHGRHW